MTSYIFIEFDMIQNRYNKYLKVFFSLKFNDNQSAELPLDDDYLHRLFLCKGFAWFIIKNDSCHFTKN